MSAITEKNKELRIDVQGVLVKKNPDLAKKLPVFLINYLKNIVHQEELNDFLSKHGDKYGVEFGAAFMDYLNLTIEVKNLDKLPNGKLYSFASNHPLGGLDGIALAIVLGQKYSKIKILVNDILMSVPNLAEFFLPINKHGAQAREAAKKINETYHSDNQILQFPAGLVSRKQKGRIEDLEWKKTFITKTIAHQRDVVPIHVSGENSSFFYNMANIRKLLGIKSNFEMLYLPNEMFKFRNRKITITFGEPIRYSYFDKSKSQNEWAEYVKRIVYDLPAKEV